MYHTCITMSERYVRDSAKAGAKKGELKTPVIRRLVRTHNRLMDIYIPPRSTRGEIMKIIEKNGYSVNHETGTLQPKTQMKRKQKITLKQADKLFPKKK